MAEYVQKGEIVDFVASAKALTRGEAVTFGGRIAIAADNIAKGARGQLHLCGVWRFESATSLDVGVLAYLKNGEITGTAADATLVGVVVAAGTGYLDIKIG